MGLFLGWLILSIVVGLVASERGRSGGGYFLVSLLLSPLIGLILVLATPNLKLEAARAKERELDRAYQRDLVLKAPSPAPAPVDRVSAADEIEKLASLKERGALTLDEFAAEKAKVLARSAVSRTATRAEAPISVEDCDALLASAGYRVESCPDGSFKIAEPLGSVARVPDLERLVLYTRQRQLHRSA